VDLNIETNVHQAYQVVQQALAFDLPLNHGRIVLHHRHPEGIIFYQEQIFLIHQQRA